MSSETLERTLDLIFRVAPVLAALYLAYLLMRRVRPRHPPHGAGGFRQRKKKRVGPGLVIALAGWVLIRPPITQHFREDGCRWTADVDVPVETWEPYATFGTAEECEQQRIRLADRARENTAGYENSSWGQAVRLWTTRARCISSE